ncbi:nucleoid-associated protein [Pseudomonas taiwanensis]|uniref:Nucleoid-associated protein n=1 Tax=Pseudomonas taiwanensis TaxID=470150 RepID=A0ABR6V7E8_9PSED|nr:nucleoid-associated protein [Pseudomonas taiwanensis]MBC3475777.1 nucleoid-associated protein [Pseudomonas taiwanensis]
MDDRVLTSPQTPLEAEAPKPEVKPLVVLNACAAKFFKKTLGGHTFYDSNKGSNWDLRSPVCVEFVSFIGKKFSKSGRIYGYVDADMLSAAANFSKYASDLHFDAFVNGVMTQLCDEANDPARRSLSEGYVVFSHYQDHREVDHLLIVMLGKKAGYDFDNDSNLNPKDTESLNLQDFRQAACMDLTEFRKGFPQNTGDSYLYFIKGNSKSEFFTAALGCSDSIPGKVCVDNLKNALGAYFQEDASSLTLTERRTIHKRVVEYIENKAGERIHLSEIQHVIDKCLREGSSHHGGLIKFISENAERFKVSEEFQPSGVTAKSIAYVDLKLPSGEFAGRFKLDAVAVDKSDADLSVDKDFVYLKVKLPIEVSQQLRSINADYPSSGAEDA